MTRSSWSRAGSTLAAFPLALATWAVADHDQAAGAQDPGVGRPSAVQTTARAGGPRTARLSAVPVDLGTLGGGYAEVSDVDGSVLVGTSSTASGTRHAFAYDLAAPQPHMVDLTPGYSGSSEARDVADGVVVGSIDMGEGRVAFAYDLTAPAPHPVEIAGPRRTTWATTVVGHVVVLTSNRHWRYGSGTHTYIYDLAATAATPVDIGTLGGGYTRATAVSGSWLLGYSETADGQEHPFRYDLAAAQPALVDLDSAVPGPVSAASGALVAGITRSDPPYVFVADLSQQSPVPRILSQVDYGSDLAGTDGRLVLVHQYPAFGSFVVDLEGDPGGVHRLGDRRDYVDAADIDDGLVVGVHTSGRDQRALLYDFQGGWPVAVELPAPVYVGGGRPDERHLSRTDVNEISGLVAGGSAAFKVKRGGRTTHAVAWRMQPVPSGVPTVALERTQIQVREGRTAVVTVRRSGPVDGTSSVRYATVLDRSASSDDVVMRRGVLTFRPGQDTRRIRVRVAADDLVERGESLLLEIADATGAMLTLSSSTQILIRAG